jgi:phosphatidylserine decarboxylase
MAVSRYPYFSRAGWAPLLGVVAFALLVGKTLGWGWTLPLWLACALIVYLYRDPYREIPSSPLAVVSPADGVVRAVEEVSDPYLARDAVRLEIQMSHAGVYSTRSPVEGKILEPRNPGNGDQPYGVWLKTDEDDDLVVVMHRGPLHNLPRCFVQVGERVGQGQRCGYIQMGGRVELYLPRHSRIEVSSGSHVKAGSDVIATLVHKQTA